MRIISVGVWTVVLSACAALHDATMHADMKKCREEILSQLKAPSTAHFSEWKRHDDAFMRRFVANQLKERPTVNDEWEKTQRQRWRALIASSIDMAAVRVTVDAQNSYGAMIRSHWNCDFGAWQYGEYQLGQSRDASGNRIDSSNTLWNYRTIVYIASY